MKPLLYGLREGLARLTPRHTAWLVLGLMLLTAGADLPARLGALADLGPILTQWGDPAAQYRRQLAPVPADWLQAADAALPRQAAVLLLTPGEDTRRLEYTTYHRALYFLAPRPVWWAVPTPADGSWQARWWITTPRTAAAIRALAAAKGVDYALSLGPDPPPDLGLRIAHWPDGDLFQLDAAAPPVPGAGPQSLAPGPAWPLLLAAAVAVWLLVGHAALALVGRLGYRAGEAEAWALAPPLGMGLTTLLMLALGVLGLGLATQIVIITMGAGAWAMWCGARFLRRWPTRSRVWKTNLPLVSRLPPLVRPGPAQVLGGLILLFLLLQGSIVLLNAMGHPLQIWDSWVNWGSRARMIFLEGAITPAVWAEPSRAVTLPDYPLLLPLSEAWVYGWLGVPDDRLVGVVTVLHWLALVGLLGVGARQAGASVLAAVATAGAGGTIFYLAGLDGVVFADGVVAVYILIAGWYAVRWRAGGPPGLLVLAALGAGLAAWTKREGLVIVLALALALLLVGCTRRAWRAVGVLAGGVAVLAGPWWIFVAGQHLVNPNFASLTPATFLANAGHWRTIAHLTLASLLGYKWSFLWPLATLAAGRYWLGGPRPRLHSWNALPVAAVLYILMSAGMYFFSAYVPYEQHILTSVDRLIAQVAPLVVLWVAVRGLGMEGGDGQPGSGHATGDLSGSNNQGEQQPGEAQAGALGQLVGEPQAQPR